MNQGCCTIIKEGKGKGMKQRKFLTALSSLLLVLAFSVHAVQITPLRMKKTR
jgi:hypothetical protein